MRQATSTGQEKILQEGKDLENHEMSRCLAVSSARETLTDFRKYLTKTTLFLQDWLVFACIRWQIRLC